MDTESTPTLADDEAALARYATELANRVEDVAEAWLARLVALRSPGLEDQDHVVQALNRAAAETVQALRDVLSQDIAKQSIGPLEILRRAVSTPTAILAEADVAPVERDDFARTNFANDVYDLTPASFAAVDPSLHEPGLIWGAAKAHVHLRRRREQEAGSNVVDSRAQRTRHIVVLSADLMDRSKISAALPDAMLVRSEARLAEAAADADLVIVDLSRVDDPSKLHEITSPVIAFGSHVNEALLGAAADAGADALARSVFFRRLEAGEI